MEGKSVYVVMFEGGTVRIGSTYQPKIEIKKAMRAGLSVGVRAANFFCTEPHASHEETEAALSENFSREFSPVGEGSFSGANRERIRELMIGTGLLVTWGDETWLPASQEKKKRANDKIFDKVLAAIRKSKNGLTMGVIKNKFSKVEGIEAVVEILVKENKDLKEIYSLHPRNKMKVVTIKSEPQEAKQ